MKIRTKVVLSVGVAGLSLGACTPPVLKIGGRYVIGSPPTTTTSVPPKNAPVGFNAARTEFVLPYNLGYLPAPELALAKVDPSYASGLAIAKDWTQIQTQDSSGLGAVETWVYVGTSGDAWSISLAKSDVTGLNYKILWTDGAPGTSSTATPSQIILHSSPVAVNVSTLNTGLEQFATSTITNAIPSGALAVDASTLEIQAAPVGTLAVGGARWLGFCVPVPLAFVNSGGTLFDPPGLPVMTAGPSTIYVEPPDGSNSALNDKGVGFCNNFH